MHPGIPIALVFIGCCSNVVFLEYLISEFPESGNIVTFSQFLFIALEGFIFTFKFGTVKPVIPLRNYIKMVSFFFVVQVVNNYAYSFHISIPLQMIFRAGSLIANLTLGMIILKKRYSREKYLSVLLITFGIATCTIASATDVEAQPGHTGNVLYDFGIWLCGIGLLTVGLFMAAGMGIFQEQVYAKFGKHPKEALFYNHALPLPGFLLIGSSIYKHALIFNESAPLEIVSGFSMPKMWFYLLANILTQYVCIRAVFILTTECTSLTVTMVVTLRKFVSLIFSIWYFQNPFTLCHWIGTGCVFFGTFLFTELFYFSGSKKKKKDD